ncbi:MAG: UvrD-helicase domain-containing protein [Fibrobacter sp.]|nr:UvrD-helicase domain-containing protein [Fibrobacter sp.]
MDNFSIDEFKEEENLFIAASAGTGKTYTIQQVVARLVLSGLTLDQILIVTYTEKAAGELKDRIRKKIEEESLKAPGNAMLQQALRDIHSAPIGTIHSFCEKVSAEFAYEASVPFEQEMIDESAVEDLIEKLIRDNWIHEELFITFLKSGGNVAGLSALLKSAIQTYIPETIVLPPDSDITAGNAPLTYSELGKISEAKNYEDLLLVEIFAAAVHVLQSNADQHVTKSKTAKDLLTAIKEWRKGKALYSGNTFRISIGEPRDEFETALKTIVDFKSLLDTKKGIDTLLLQKCLFTYIPRLYREWEKEKRTKKIQSFNDMIRNVRNAVMVENSPLVRSLRQKFRYAIIDEFQDTNALQWDIFKKIFVEADDGQHHILVVGDPKQSIYSFQGADLNVYEKAISEIGHGKALATNWRSNNVMIDACNTLFETSPHFHLNFTPSACPPEAKPNAEYKGNAIKPFWISAEDIEPKEYAEIVVNNIIDFCTFDGNKTRLQVPDKKTGDLRNVKFSDFAILARTRSELEHVEYKLRKVGLPFLRYKDDNLFTSRECAEWSALLKAIDIDNYSERNRNLLYAALLTDFWGRDLDYINALTAGEKNIEEISTFVKWHALAESRRWAELQESIYAESPNMGELYQPENLQSLNKIRQIGDYAVEYLYTTNCSLEELVRHLDALVTHSENALKDSSIVAKGTDLDVIQTMTIHASKGLEYPIVISVAGERGHAGSSGPYLVHSETDSRRSLSFDDNAKELSKHESEEEWRRLFYVAFTRATHMLIMPRFAKMKKRADGKLQERKKEMTWLSVTMDDFCQNSTNQELYYERLIEKPVENVKARISQILDGMGDGKKDTGLIDAQKLAEKMAAWKVWGRFPHSTSYSQIAHGKQEQETDEGRLQKDEGDGATRTVKDTSTYPRGAELGNALHKIFELVDFQKIGQADLQTLKQDSAFKELIVSSFLHESLDIDSHPDWLDTTIAFVWNTLNASITVIEGHTKTAEAFSLNEIANDSRRSEMLFFMDLKSEREKEVINLYCKGFMDLLFKRNGRYCILDWKSDYIDTYDEPAMKNQMLLRRYNVQQVLYSYVLIRWLKSFYPQMSEQEIFDNYFGGIYYVFFRGCRANENSGIVASTFSSFEELEKLYREIIA